MIPYFNGMVITKEPLEMTVEEHNAEQARIQDALAQPPVTVPDDDSLLGEPVAGYEGIYWHVKENDTTPHVGLIKSFAGVTVPSVVHIPTGSTVSYRKILKDIDGKKTPIWEIHQKDLSSSHEPYEI